MSLRPNDLHYFKNELLSMKDNVYKRHRKHDLNVDIEELKSHSNHMGDSATAEYEQKKEMTLRDTDEDLLNEIDEALERIENGTYGICVDTGEEITKQRLEAIPYAKRTIEAQRRFDQQRNYPKDQNKAKREDPSDTVEQIEEEQNSYGR